MPTGKDEKAGFGLRENETRFKVKSYLFLLWRRCPAGRRRNSFV